jgi:NAD+ synthase (glutamine-hydrolysing)
MKIALSQTNPISGDIKGNTRKIISFYKRSKEEGVKLCIMPEMAITGYVVEDLLGRADFIKDSISAIDTIKKEVDESCALILGNISLNTGKGNPLFNSAYFIENKKVKAIVNKKYLPNYRLFKERKFFEEGTETNVIDFNGYKLGVLVCADMWREENNRTKKLYKREPVNDLIKKGAKFLINISASPYSIGKDTRRRGVLKNISEKFNTPFITVNTVGGNDGVIFDGKSKVIYKGKIIEELSGFKEDFKIIDIKNFKTKDIKEREEIENIYNALKLGLKDYLEKNGLKKVIIGLSGGIDSAVCVAIASSVVENDNLICVNMPTRFSSTGSITDSKKLCENLKIDMKLIDIDSFYESINSEVLKHGKNSLTTENIQPRIRGMFLMALSNLYKKSIVIAPGNKSELATGYSTLYGDTCGALSLIGDVYKTKVYKLAKFINSKKEIIPREIIEKAPSAELKVDQFDIDTLPDYSILDKILKLHVEEKNGVDEILEKLKVEKKLVVDIVKRVKQNEYKRRQTPFSIRISERSFNLDRTFPITNKYF